MNANLLVGTSSYSSGRALGDMEGQGGHDSPLQLMTSTSGGMGAKGATCYLPKDVSNQHIVVAAERNRNHPIAQPIPHWIHYQQTSHNRVKFHAESSTAHSVVPARDIPPGVCLPLGSVQDVKGVFQYQRDILCNNSGMANDFIATDSFIELDASKAKPYVHMLNFNNREASINPSRVLCSDQNEMLDGENYNVPVIRSLKPHDEGKLKNKLTSTKDQTLAQKFLQQNHTSGKQESIEDKCNVSQTHSTVTVAVPGFPSRPCNRVSRQRASETDRLRRARIAERLKALRKLLPNSEEGNKASLLDDIIDHVKYLQLQIKALGQSRLGGEANADPFIHLEGYGHYLLHQQMLNEPLEEIMVRLMEVNPSAATQLLESKGLSVIPMDFAQGLF